MRAPDKRRAESMVTGAFMRAGPRWDDPDPEPPAAIRKALAEISERVARMEAAGWRLRYEHEYGTGKDVARVEASQNHPDKVAARERLKVAREKHRVRAEAVVRRVWDDEFESFAALEAELARLLPERAS